jgi:hypothetical protein
MAGVLGGVPGAGLGNQPAEVRSVRADGGEEHERAISRSNRSDRVALERVNVEVGHDIILFSSSIRTIRWMPNVLQEACQFHSLAVNRGFSGFGILFQREFCGYMVKITDNGKNVKSSFRT